MKADRDGIGPFVRDMPCAPWQRIVYLYNFWALDLSGPWIYRTYLGRFFQSQLPAGRLSRRPELFRGRCGGPGLEAGENTEKENRIERGGRFIFCRSPDQITKTSSPDSHGLLVPLRSIMIHYDLL